MLIEWQRLPAKLPAERERLVLAAEGSRWVWSWDWMQAGALVLFSKSGFVAILGTGQQAAS